MEDLEASAVLFPGASSAPAGCGVGAGVEVGVVSSIKISIKPSTTRDLFPPSYYFPVAQLVLNYSILLCLMIPEIDLSPVKFKVNTL